MEFGRSLEKSWLEGNVVGRPAALRRSLASTMAIVGGALLVVTSTACDDECAPGEISVACPAEPESPPAPSPEPDVNISAPPSTCAELIPEFTREAFNRAENHDTCNDDDDCIVFSPQFLCGDDSSVTTCPVAIAQSAQATYQEELGAYSRALCEATPDLACIDVDECRTGRPFCNSGTCAFLAAPERTCAQIEADYNARVAAFERDGRNFSAADNCVLRSEPLVCNGDTVASPCPVAISPDFAPIFDANLQQLREDRCAEIAERASPCTAPTLCADVYVDSRDGLQCVAIVDPASCPAPEVLAAEGPCSVEGKVCDVPCDESCGPENCGYTATCDAGQWSTTTPAPPPRCRSPIPATRRCLWRAAG